MQRKPIEAAADSQVLGICYQGYQP
ncbi:unnamed protein product [Victoria cruziana]